MLVTHGNLPYREGHTAWAEIEAFARIVRNLMTEKVDVIPPNDWCFDDDLNEDIVVFCSGPCDTRLIEQINQSSCRVFVVIQDPNYPVKFQINRPFTLVTPFERFDHFSKSCSDMRLSSFVHKYVPFGAMSLRDNEYSEFYDAATLSSIYPVYENVYVGSLKPDRREDFSRLSTIGCDFYGNFSQSQLESLIGHSAKCRCFGRTETPYVVPEIYQHYKYATLMIDKKMFDLRVNHIRFVEYARAGVKVRVVNELNDDYREWLLRYATQLSEYTFRFEIDKFVDDVLSIDDCIKEVFA